MGKRELLSSTITSPKSEKWFRFKGLCFGRRYGGTDDRIEVMAPTVRELRKKLAKELAEKKVEINYACLDRILVHLYKGGPLESGLIRRDVINGMQFVKETQLSNTYRDLIAQKVREITQRTKEVGNGR